MYDHQYTRNGLKAAVCLNNLEQHGCRQQRPGTAAEPLVTVIYLGLSAADTAVTWLCAANSNARVHLSSGRCSGHGGRWGAECACGS